MVCGDIRLRDAGAQCMALDQFQNIWRDIPVPEAGHEYLSQRRPASKRGLASEHIARQPVERCFAQRNQRSFAPLAHDPEHAFGGVDFKYFQPDQVLETRRPAA